MGVVSKTFTPSKISSGYDNDPHHSGFYSKVPFIETIPDCLSTVILHFMTLVKTLKHFRSGSLIGIICIKSVNTTIICSSNPTRV